MGVSKRARNMVDHRASGNWRETAWRGGAQGASRLRTAESICSDSAQQVQGALSEDCCCCGPGFLLEPSDECLSTAAVCLKTQVDDD